MADNSSALADSGDTFISYASADASVANSIVAALEKEGLQCWIAPRDVVPGSLYADGIVKAINGTRSFVLVLSEHALASKHVGKELERASSKGHPIFAIRTDSAPLTPAFEYFLSESQWIDVGAGGIDATAARLISAMRNVATLGGASDLSARTNPPHAAIAGVQTAPARRPHAPALHVGLPPARRNLALVVGVVVIVIGAVWYGVLKSPAAHVENGSASVGAAPAPEILADRPAIAVLPFKNLSEDPQQAIFADGLAEDLITRLSSWRAFPVIAPGSSFLYRGDVDLKKVGSELNVRYIVQGSVQRAGDRIRISVQLVDTQSNQNLWSRTYDRKMADVFELQDEIGSTIAASLVADLTRAEGERARQRGINNLDAWSAYELGVQHLGRMTPKDNADARGLFEQALVLDPQSASSTAALSNVYSQEVGQGWTDSPESSAARALELARRAVELDPGNSQAHVALAFALAVGSDFQSAIASAERAVELNPSAPAGWWVLANAKDLAGDLRGAVAAIEQAIRLDPQSNNTAFYFDTLSYTEFDASQYEAGLEAARKVVASYPYYSWGYIDLAINAVPFGRIDEARAAIVEARRLQPNLSQAMIQKNFGASRPEIDARRNAALSQAGLD